MERKISIIDVVFFNIFSRLLAMCSSCIVDMLSELLVPNAFPHPEHIFIVAGKSRVQPTVLHSSSLNRFLNEL